MGRMADAPMEKPALGRSADLTCWLADGAAGADVAAAVGEGTMKQPDFQPCCLCHKGIMHTGLPVFYRIRIESMGIDIKAVNRQLGFEQFMGGNAALAYHMGAQESLASSLDEGKTLLLCHACALDSEATMCHLIAAMEED